MAPNKLIETRGEEPAFIPGHIDETWQKVDLGLGATSMQTAPGVKESLPPQQRHWGRMFIYSAIAGLITLVCLFVLSKTIGWPRP